MKPGEHVLDLIRNAPAKQRTIVLIRHSKRQSFEGIPDHLRDTIGITSEGILMAREFGESMKQISPNRRLFLGHTVAERCKMTAQSICEGYSSNIPPTIFGCELEIQSPVVNLEKLVAATNEFGWQELIRKWLGREIPEDTLWDPHKYSDEILAKLLSYPTIRPGDLLVVVAHDITLFPLVFSLFGKNVKAIEFLNGMVISVDSKVADVRFRNAEYSFKTECLIS